MDLPLWEDLPTTDQLTAHNSSELSKYPNTSTDIFAHDTESLLREFESIYDKVELKHYNTPPESPTSLFYPSEIEQLNTFKDLVSSSDWDKTFVNDAPEDISSGIYGQHVALDISNEIYGQQDNFYLENLNQQFTQETIPLNDESSILKDEVYYQVTENSFSSEENPVSSPDTYSSLSSDQDDEWVPIERLSRNKHAYKPYRRSESGDPRKRKKEQNKNAATRYRQKKKAQIEEIIGKEQDLLESNKELKIQCADIEREIKYLKDLMRELFKAKGMI